MTTLKTQIEYFADLRGKTTQGEWDVDAYCIEDCGIPTVRRDVSASHEDIEAMSKLPQALDLIAELADKVEKLEDELQLSTNVFRQASVAFSNENAELKARIQELEAGK